MQSRISRSVWLALAACCALVISGMSAAGAGARTKAHASKKGKVSHVLRGKRGKRGRRGPVGFPGPAGPKGPTGDQGSAGPDATAPVKVSPFKFLAIGNTSNTTIQTVTGAIAEAGCQNGAFTDARLRSTADNGAAETLNLRTKQFSFQPDFDTGENVLLNVQSAGDQHGLTYMSAGGVQVMSAHYSAYSGQAIGGSYDCAIFGTSQVG